MANLKVEYFIVKKGYRNLYCTFDEANKSIIVHKGSQSVLNIVCTILEWEKINEEIRRGNMEYIKLFANRKMETNKWKIN